MLIQLKFKNFLSFKEETVISMEAEKDGELKENTTKHLKSGYLKSLCVFGANAYGKTNILKAFIFLKKFILNSYDDSLKSQIIGEAIPFQFDDYSNNKSSLFEIIFLYKKNKYRYGFKIKSKKIEREYLYIIEPSKKPREKLYFERNASNKVTLGPNFQKYSKIFNDKKNVLFLTKLALESDEVEELIFSWFKYQINIIGGYDNSYKSYSLNRLEKDYEFRKRVITYLQAIDSGISGLKIGKTTITDPKKYLDTLPPEVRNAVINNNVQRLEKRELLSVHKKFDKNKKEIKTQTFPFDIESRGTQTTLNLLGPIIDTLETGKLLIIDELDSGLHPNLVKFLTSLFNSKENKNKAQLIFTTHCVSLLDKNEIGNNSFRRDQISFVDKNKYGESSFFSLSDIRINKYKIRKDENYLKNYLLGKYEAVPFIDDFLIE